MSDLVDNFLALDNLAENRVQAIQVRCRNFRDKELRTTRAWVAACVRHTQTPGSIEHQRRMKFSRDTVRPAHSGSFGIAGLNHEPRDHAMKDQPVVQRPLYTRFRFGIRPLLSTHREVREVLYRLRRFLFKEFRHDGSHGSRDCGVQARLASWLRSLGCRFRGRRGGRRLGVRKHRQQAACGHRQNGTNTHTQSVY